ncbi:hypothetical protein C0991_010768 [Blastosporella zonata]|nr:hypothetical protein C0991_010768 [Blastosporella zonata]
MLVSFALSLLLATSAFANPLEARTRVCGTVPTGDAVAIMEKHFQENQVGGSEKQNGASALRTIQVYWHVISADDTLAGGNLPASQIEEQISVMNKGYASIGIRWALKKTTHTVNPDWFSNVGPETDQQTAMKTQLRQGGSADLNVYSVGFKNGTGMGLLGYATFPYDYEDAPQDDGVVILYSTVPGGTTAPYNLGQPDTGLASTTPSKAAAPALEIRCSTHPRRQARRLDAPPEGTPAPVGA